jgi:lipopolysaccharide/colanic/teichoic acid biosynthesis glycosyltransferase
MRTRRRSLFGFGLLIYLVLSVVVFDLVWRYMPRLANRIGHIEYGWLRFGIYFTVYVLLALGLAWVARRLPPRLSRERRLRLAFIVGATLSFAVAVYQNRFGTGLSATYLTVGVLGAFAGVLLVTRAYFGLIEVNAAPSPEVEAEVRRAHAHVVLANDLWDHVKRGLEIVLALALIVVSLPISIGLAMVIWVQDPGPLLIAKVAVTRGGRSFHLYKLRSMIKNAEQATGAVPAAPDDERITRFGHALRRMHIDELPQMVNIARGDMSLVGPRPERTVFVRRHITRLPHYVLRHAVRPGLAGMAAVYGDYWSTPREKLRYDLLYIKRRSFALDLKLLLAAALSALGVFWPGMNRGRRAWNEQRKDERFRRAYEALHGGEPEPRAPARQAGGRPKRGYGGKLERLRDADEGTTTG